jgi:hypothetical protein
MATMRLPIELVVSYLMVCLAMFAACVCVPAAFCVCVFALICIVPTAFMSASLCICRLIINYLTSCLSFCAQAPGAPSPVEAIAVLDMSAAVADRAPVPSFPCAQAAAGVFLDIEAIIISPNIPDPADAAPVPSFTCAQAAAGVPPCVEAIIISANIPDPADAAPAAEPAKPFELSLELLSANTAALHAAEKARCLATLPPAAPITSDTLSAAQLHQNREDRIVALNVSMDTKRFVLKRVLYVSAPV